MKKTYLFELLAICAAAALGSVLASLVIGVLGVFLAAGSSSNVELERGAAIVGAIAGSMISIPMGFFAGLLAGHGRRLEEGKLVANREHRGCLRVMGPL